MPGGSGAYQIPERLEKSALADGMLASRLGRARSATCPR
jgi:hypothetical protein